MKNNFSNINAGVFIAIVLCGIALYFHPLQSATFCSDDHYSIENNDAIKTIDIPRIFDAFNTRFLAGLSFALNYQFCGLHAAGYRWTNLLIHCLNAFLVYLLVKSTLYLYQARKRVFFCPLEWPAFFASMLFLCHPIQTEPVNFITQRFVLMGSFFYLLTMVLYIQYRCRSQKRYMIASFGSAVAAMFCKEFVVTLPVMLVLYDFYFLGTSKERIWARLRHLLPFFVIVLIVPVLLLKTPSGVVGVANIANSTNVGKHIDITRARSGISRRQYFLTELNVMCTYVRLMFLPVNQTFDYDYPISHQLDNKTALCGVFLLCLLALAAVTYKSYRLISFGILWFFIALSVESSLIPIGHVIAEYRVYLASVGFVILVMTWLYMRRMDGKRLNMIAAVILVIFSILTYERNKVWQDEFTLWNDTVQKFSHRARPYYDRGLSFFSLGKLTDAISDLNTAIAIDPNYADAYNKRGLVYYKQGQFTQALSDFNRTIAIDPDNEESYINRGNLYVNQGKLLQAIADYTKVIGIDPKYAKAYYNRGKIYGAQGRSSQAISDYTKALEIMPHFAEAYNNRGNTYGDQGKLPQAISDFTKAIEIDPSFAEAYNNRGTTYGQQGSLEQAISDFTKAIEINPAFAGAYYNRGFAYYYEKEYARAWADVRKAQVLGAAVNPDFINRLKEASGHAE